MRPVGQQTWGRGARRVALASFQALQPHESEEEGQVSFQDTALPCSCWALSSGVGSKDVDSARCPELSDGQSVMGITSGLVLNKSSSRLLVVCVVPWGDVLLFSYPLCPRTACKRQLSLLLVFSIGSHPRFRVASECLSLLFSVLLPAEPGKPEKLFLPWALGLRWRKRCTYLFPSHSAKSAGCSPKHPALRML